MAPPRGFPRRLVRGQSNIAAGVGENGRRNGRVIWIKASNGTRECIPGVIVGPRLVATAQHFISGVRERLAGSADGKVEVYVVSPDEDFNLKCRARGRHSWMDEMQWAPWDKICVEKFPLGEDCVYIELKCDLQVPDNQPKIITVNETHNLIDFLEGVRDSSLEVGFEGMSSHISHGERAVGDYILVHWEELKTCQWTYTGTTQANAGDLARALRDALKSCRKRGTRGTLEIPNLWCPAGFSGGGAYIKVPARGLDPAAPPDAPGIWILVGIVVASNIIEKDTDKNVVVVKLLTQEEMRYVKPIP